MNDFQNLPKNTCAYECFDPDTLEPLNDVTFTRLAELGWAPTEFKDKEVLDIGCNSGLLSIYAARLGAKHVYAYDVQQPLVDFFAELTRTKQVNRARIAP